METTKFKKLSLDLSPGMWLAHNVWSVLPLCNGSINGISFNQSISTGISHSWVEKHNPLNK